MNDNAQTLLTREEVASLMRVHIARALDALPQPEAFKTGLAAGCLATAEGGAP